ncbi:MAG: hypothetical protein HY327_06995 [Chloroflexi bacterium]|nr:hypothetical protein [Chloroflexota bacterium]
MSVAAIRRWALRRNLLDIPNERSSHLVPTPRGGLAIAAIVLIGFGISRLWAAELAPGSFAGYILGALIVAAISAADDVVHVSAKAHLLVHLLAAIVFVAMAGRRSQVASRRSQVAGLRLGTWDLA